MHLINLSMTELAAKHPIINTLISTSILILLTGFLYSSFKFATFEFKSLEDTTVQDTIAFIVCTFIGAMVAVSFYRHANDRRHRS